MEVDVEPPTAAYINRPPKHSQAALRGRLETLSGRHSTRRAVDRMRLALRGYEQRAQRRTALRAWLLARQASSSAHTATLEGANG